MGAADTFRAAAVEQLTIWGKRLGMEIVTGPSGSNPASVALAAVAPRPLEIGADVCIVDDTAGRLQTQQGLMQQLTKIHRVLGKQIADAPHEVLLVLDATTGQNGIRQAQHFTKAVQLHRPDSGQARRHGPAAALWWPFASRSACRSNTSASARSAEDLALFKPGPFVDALFEDVG